MFINSQTQHTSWQKQGEVIMAMVEPREINEQELLAMYNRFPNRTYFPDLVEICFTLVVAVIVALLPAFYFFTDYLGKTMDPGMILVSLFMGVVSVAMFLESASMLFWCVGTPKWVEEECNEVRKAIIKSPNFEYHKTEIRMADGTLRTYSDQGKIICFAMDRNICCAILVGGKKPQAFLIAAWDRKTSRRVPFSIVKSRINSSHMG